MGRTGWQQDGGGQIADMYASQCAWLPQKYSTTHPQTIFCLSSFLPWKLICCLPYLWGIRELLSHMQDHLAICIDDFRTYDSNMTFAVLDWDLWGQIVKSMNLIRLRPEPSSCGKLCSFCPFRIHIFTKKKHPHIKIWTCLLLLSGVDKKQRSLAHLLAEIGMCPPTGLPRPSG